MRSLLFVSWDGPQVNYLEGLFLPIFVGLKDRYNIHIIQFSWAGEAKVSKIKNSCKSAGIAFTHISISRKPHPLIGTVFSLGKGIRKLRQYIKHNKIDIVMPRSTFPGLMALYALKSNRNVKFAFDADGLPTEERVDFAGLNPEGLQYRLLKAAETSAIKRADLVITRTEKTIKVLSSESPELSGKFRVVTNGRNASFFKRVDGREKVRLELSISPAGLLLVYAGSLGPQYCLSEMLKLHQYVSDLVDEAYLLILTGTPEYLSQPQYQYLLNSKVIVRSVEFKDVPLYLSAADVGLAIRQPSFSMQGVAPIKIGEYLLTGLPVVASAGIGDTETILPNEISCHVLADHKDESLRDAAKWIVNIVDIDSIKESARLLGEKEFGIEKSITLYKSALSTLY
jgi:glycosyltransferase involved in cell wall biosynthesis